MSVHLKEIQGTPRIVCTKRGWTASIQKRASIRRATNCCWDVYGGSADPPGFSQAADLRYLYGSPRPLRLERHAVVIDETHVSDRPLVHDRGGFDAVASQALTKR